MTVKSHQNRIELVTRLAHEAAKAKAAAEAEPDVGGWVTVSRHSGKTKRKPLGLGTKTGQAKIKARDAKRRKRKEMLDFYKFQVGHYPKQYFIVLLQLTGLFPRG